MSSTNTDLADTRERAFPSKLEGQRLVHNRMRMAKLDYQWKRRKTDMDEAEKLYKGEGKNNTLDAEGDIPRVNKIERAVDDTVSVALDNIPKVEMISTKEVAAIENPVAQSVITEAIQDSEKTINGYMREIMQDNAADDEYERATKQAGIYGVGFVKVSIDDAMDTRRTQEAVRLLQKPMNQWREDEWKLYQALSKRIDISWIDSRDVAMQHGHRRYDEDMLRVSYIERASTKSLRVQYDNPRIKPGQFPFYINEDPDRESDITGVLTTWELEPVYVTKKMQRQGQVIETKFTAWQLVKTVIAGGVLIEKSVSDPMNSITHLPVVPIYIKEAETHPYGDPIPLKLKYSEMYINLMRLITYKSAKNAASNSGLLVDANALTENDRERVNRVLDEGGAAAIEGHVDGPVGLDDIVVPVGNTQSTLNRASIEAMRNEERVFQEMSQSLDIQALERAESGAGKRAQVMAQDRAKGISIGNLHRSIRMVYDRVYEFIRSYHGKENMPVVVRESDGSRRRVRLNQKAQTSVPKITKDGTMKADPRLKSQNNPLGLVEETLEYRLNDTTLNMKAEVNGRGDLPSDPVARFNLLLMWLQAQLITPETFRELQLDPWIKAVDNKNREKKRQKQMQQIRQQQEQQQRAKSSPESRDEPMAEDGTSQNSVPGSVEDGEIGSNTGSGMLALQNEQGGAEGTSAQGSTPQEQAEDDAKSNPELQRMMQQLQGQN